MKSFAKLIIPLFFLTSLVFAREKEPGTRPADRFHGLRKVAGTPAQTVIDINNVTSWVRYDGFFDWVIESSWNGTFPKGTSGCIFSEGIVWGGFVKDGQTPELRVGGSTYRTGLVGGAILTEPAPPGKLGKVIGREDPEAPDVRAYRVRPDWRTADLRDDAANFFVKRLDEVTDDEVKQLRDQYWKDWVEWPAHKGAPYDDRDGVPGYNPDADGRPQDPITGKLFDVPGIPGADQTVWYVANDLGPNATVYGSPSIGLEMQMTLWAYKVKFFRNMIFKRVRLIYKGTEKTPATARIDSMYIVQWSDPDLGTYSDDYAGCDTTLGLGFIWNSTSDDDTYKNRWGLPPPAMGYDFLQGVMVPGAPTDTAIFDFKKRPGFKNLPMTVFAYFVAGGKRSDPDLGRYSGTLQWYNLMSGYEPRPEYPSRVPFTDYLTGKVTKFEVPGDPITGQGWIDGLRDSPGDRRLVLSTGPFTMARGDTQEVVIALVGGLGADNLSSVSILKSNDRFAQDAYDALFKALPGAPPPPKVTVTELSNQIVLEWGSDLAKVNDVENVVRKGFTFEGYNVYQLPTARSRFPEEAIKLATYDLTNGIRTILDREFDPVAKTFLDIPVAVGNDGGVKHYYSTQKDAVRNRPLVNGQTYFFVVTSYSYNPDPGLAFHALESEPVVLKATPQSPKPGERYPKPEQAAFGYVIEGEHIQGKSDGSVIGVVIDPAKLNGHTYKVTFDTVAGQTVWNLTDISVTPPEVKLPNQTNQSGDDAYLVVDGIMAKVRGPALDFKRFSEVANGAGPHPPTTADFYREFDGTNATRQVGGGFFFIVAGGPTITSYEAAVGRWTRNGARWARLIPNDYEIRFTERGGKAWLAFTTGKTIPVPFELWYIGVGTPDDPSDDVRMIPWLFDDNENGIFDFKLDHQASGGNNDPYSDWIYFMMPPDRTPGEAGYNAFVAASAAAGDTAYSGIGEEEHLARVVIMNWNQQQSGGAENAMPDVGTVFRIELTKPNGLVDVFTLTAPLGSTLSAEAAKVDVEKINVFPNPYYGFNVYEQDRLQKYVTFNHLPEEATIRIFALSGSLVKVIEKKDPSQFARWNLRNENNLPVASGIYIVHIEMPKLGKEKVLKLAVIQEEEILRTY